MLRVDAYGIFKPKCHISNWTRHNMKSNMKIRLEKNPINGENNLDSQRLIPEIEVNWCWCFFRTHLGLDVVEGKSEQNILFF